MTETKLNELKINYLTEAQYKEAKTNGEINDDELYMTNDKDESISQIIADAILEADKRKYPVGALEFNISGVNPSNYLGFGTWQQITSFGILNYTSPTIGMNASGAGTVVSGMNIATFTYSGAINEQWFLKETGGSKIYIWKRTA